MRTLAYWAASFIDGKIACGHYNRLESDLDLIAELGVGAYRFSISWPRIQPNGSGKVTGSGFEFYDRLVDGLLARGIEPFATLYHGDLPAVLQREHNGWADRNTAYRFADYAALVAERLGDRVRSFATHNEPWVTATLGHELGHFAPGVKDRAVAMQVSHHCLLSHGLAMKAMRSSRGNLDIGIGDGSSAMRPHSSPVRSLAWFDGYLGLTRRERKSLGTGAAK